MKNTMRCRVRLRAGVATVQALIRHPMETGFRVDRESGQLVPAHYITELRCQHKDQTVLLCHWSRAVSKNPYLSFMFDGAEAGDTLTLSWQDNTGQSDQLTVTIGA